MKYLHLKPDGPLFFRTGKPFSKGQDSTAETQLLPYPSVVWGALFSTLMSHSDEPLEEFIRDESKLTIKNIYLYSEEDMKIYVPAPLDIFKDKEEKLSSQKFTEANTFLHSHHESGYNYFITPLETGKDIEASGGHFIKFNDLIKNYPEKRKYSYIKLHKADSFFRPYVKVGIGRDNHTRTSEEGALYRIEMNEFNNNYGFIVAYESKLVFPEKGILKLGGEGRTASFKTINEPEILKDISRQSENIKGKLIKLCFTTPAFIPSDFEQSVKNNGCTILAAMIGKSLSAGGFDYKNKRPKAMRKAIPAGSIFVIDSKEEKPLSSWELLFDTIFKKENNKGFNSFRIIPVIEVN